MVADALTVAVNVAGPVLIYSVVALRVTVRSVGTLALVRVIGWLKPFVGVTVTVDTPVAPFVKTSVDGSDVRSKSAVGVHVLDKTAWAGRGAKKPSPRISTTNRIFVIIGRLLWK
jgi:hypothetical protein